jgi:cytochrome c oxidase cbb3-type subunit 3
MTPRRAHRFCAVSLWAAVLAAAGCAKSPPPPPPAAPAADTSVSLAVDVTTVALAAPVTLAGAEPPIDGAAAYQKYCALCHGPQAQGYAADNAPSLVSKTFAETATEAFLTASIAQGRPGTAMAAYGKAHGGPLSPEEIAAIVRHLKKGAPPPLNLPDAPATGDARRGEAIYTLKCAQCHGTEQQRATAVHLFNPVLLDQASDQYLYYAVANGRPGTPMEGWRGKLTEEQIGDVVVYLRSKAKPTAPAPLPPGLQPAETWTTSPVIHPEGKHAEFTLKDDRLVSPEAVHQALQQKRRIVILDARAPSDYLRLHIPGSMPMPYYDLRNIDKVPNDGTWVIAYCACPHHASGEVVDALRKRGYKRTAVMDEGIYAYQHKKFEVVTAPDAAPNPAPPPDIHPGHAQPPATPQLRPPVQPAGSPSAPGAPR